MSVLALLEQRQGLRNPAVEAAAVAAQVAQKAGGDAIGVYIGPGLVDDAQKLAGLGLSKVIAYEDAALEHYSNDTYVPIVVELAKELDVKAIIAPASAIGKEWAASVAAKLDVELVQDCIGVDFDGVLKATKPVYAGKVVSEVAVKSTPAMVSVRPNTATVEPQGDTAPDVETRSASKTDSRITVKDLTQPEGEKVELTEARYIVSGGRGLGGPEHWPVLQALCDTLGAALGASRAAVDAGWIHHSHQVGQTGKVVSPDVYIACGISGAIQHQAGMRPSRLIVAINKDPEAPIFKVCDYGIVGDLFEVVPLLDQECKKVLT